MATLALPKRGYYEPGNTLYLVNIQLLEHEQIDKFKWDACISLCERPLVTASSWYLDIAAPGWMALVAGDYEYVMPLPVVKRGVLKFFLQPLFIQQAGIFALRPVNQYLADQFYNMIKNRVISINLNSQSPSPRAWRVKTLVNHVLPLSGDYDALKKGFTENCRRNIKEAAKHGLRISSNITAANFIAFSKEHAPYSLPGKSWQRLEAIIEMATAMKMGHYTGAVDEHGRFIAMAFFLDNSRRLTFLSGVSSSEGIKKRGMFHVMDHVIRQNSMSQVVLDFEGSSIDSIARFYKGFGGTLERYQAWENRFLMLLVKIRNNWISG